MRSRIQPANTNYHHYFSMKPQDVVLAYEQYAFLFILYLFYDTEDYIQIEATSSSPQYVFTVASEY